MLAYPPQPMSVSNVFCRVVRGVEKGEQDEGPVNVATSYPSILHCRDWKVNWMNNSQQGFLLKWPLDLVLWHFSANYKCRCPEGLWDKGGLREAAAVGKCHFLSLANASNGEYCLKKAASAGCKQPIESPQSSTQLHNTLQSCTSQKCTGFQNVQNAVRLHCRVQQQAMH